MLKHFEWDCTYSLNQVKKHYKTSDNQYGLDDVTKFQRIIFFLSIDKYFSVKPQDEVIFIMICLFVCLILFFTSHQQSFSYKGTGLPGLNQN